ncbi:MAG: hypothetical protein R3E32_22685 [Chitinophagales bacterium]
MTKVKFFIILFWIFCISTLNTNTASAQVYYSVGAGLAFSFNDDYQDLGTSIRGEFHIAPSTTIVPNYVAFQYLKIFSADLHMKLHPESPLYYPLVGLNVAFIENRDSGEVETKLGANLGLGGSLALFEMLSIFTEYRYIWGDKAYKQGTGNVGLLFHIN